MSQALNASQAAAYLGYADVRTLVRLKIPRSDVRVPGSPRAAWRWQVHELDAFLETRKVKPGHEGT